MPITASSTTGDRRGGRKFGGWPGAGGHAGGGGGVDGGGGGGNVIVSARYAHRVWQIQFCRLKLTGTVMTANVGIPSLSAGA